MDTRDYEKAVKNATKVSKSLKDVMKNSATQSETNKNKIKVLAGEYASAKSKVAVLTTAFNKAAKEEGVTSEKTRELARELEDAERESKDLKDQLDGLSKKADNAGDRFSKLGNALKKGLATAAKVGTAAVGVAATGVVALTKQSLESYAEYEQLAGGAQKIFNDMDYSKIATDANNAYKELGLSANQYLAVINDVGATFAATMGDEAGYEAAKTGLKAISDYASGTGKNVDELSQKFTLITRSTSSYQSIADQFSGILPATSAGFLEQAQAAGILSDSYTQLTEVPIDEYQAAVSQMLQQGVTDLGLANNTMNEAFSTLSGSLSMAKGAWNNLVTGLADDSADLDMLIGNFVESVGAVATNLIPKIGTALNGASKLVRDLIPVIVQEIPVLIEENLPMLADAAVNIVQALITGLSDNQEMLMGTALEVITTLLNGFLTMLPQVVQLGLELLVSLANGIAQNLPTLIPTIVDVVLQIVEILTSPDNLSMLLSAALVLITELAFGLVNNIDKVIDAVYQVIGSIVSFIIDGENLGKLIGAAIQIVIAIGQGIIKAIPQILVSVTKMYTGIGDTFKSFDWASLGINLVNGFANGISKAWGNLKEWFKSLFGDLVYIAKKILGIASPSKVFRQFGIFIDKGLQGGLEVGANDVLKTVEGLSNDVANSFNPDLTADYVVNYNKSGTSSRATRDQMLNGYGSSQQKVEVEVSIDDSISPLSFARYLLPYLKVAQKEAFA